MFSLKRIVGGVSPLVVLLLGLPRILAAQSDPPSTNDFMIRPGDVLSIQVWPDETLGGDFPVEESGIVYVPILGPVAVGGMPLGKVRKVLREGYATAMRAPVVTITPLFRVSVLGEVRQPGLFQVDPTLSLYQVISMAGGFGENAKEDGIQVARGGEFTAIDSPDGTGASSVDFDLRSGDRIMVPRRRPLLTLQFANLFLQSAVFIATIITLTR